MEYPMKKILSFFVALFMASCTAAYAYQPPCGANAQVQYNNNGKCGGANITYSVVGANPTLTSGTGILATPGDFAIDTLEGYSDANRYLLYGESAGNGLVSIGDPNGNYSGFYLAINQSTGIIINGAGTVQGSFTLSGELIDGLGSQGTNGQVLTSTGTGTEWASGGGGSSAFSAITSGTNTAAAMVVGTGASLAASGSGAITATAVPASGITGTLGVGNGGTGQTTYTNGQLLIGNTTGNTLTKATLTAGTAIGITNSTGSITIANTGVTSYTGDGSLISNSASTGAVTDTLVNAAANSVWGNNTSSSAAPSYQTSINISGTMASGADTITSTSANALTVGPNGTTNPTLLVDSNVANAATGMELIGGAAGSGMVWGVISSGTNEAGNLILSKGSGVATVESGGGGNLVLNTSTTSGDVLLQTGGNTIETITASSANFGSVAGGSATARLAYTGKTDTSLTTTSNAKSIYFNMGQTRTHAAGGIANQFDMELTGSTHAFASGTNTITDLATLELDGCGSVGTDGTATYGDCIYIPTWTAANTTNAVSIYTAAPTGGSSTNYALYTYGNVNMSNLATASVSETDALCLDGSGNVIADTAACLASLLEYKQDRKPIKSAEAMASIHKLAGDAISYRLTDKRLGDKRKNLPHARDRQIGFGAEWVERDEPRAAMYGRDGKLVSVRYGQITALEAVAIDDLNERIKKIESLPVSLNHENILLQIGVLAALAMSGISLYRTRNL